MTKKMIKAIRLCCGYNDNLRVKLDWHPKYTTEYDQKIQIFIIDHLLDLYGVNIYDKLGTKFNPQSGVDIEDCAKLMAFVEKESRAVCLGEVVD